MTNKKTPGEDGWVIVAVGNDSQFKQFVSAGGQVQLADDPLYSKNPQRVLNREQLVPLLEAMTRQKTKAQWLSLLEEAGVPCGPINNIKEVFENEQVIARELQFDMPHPTTGKMKLVANPIRMSKTPVEANLAPPTLGQHTEEILHNRLKLDSEQIHKLRDQGII